MNLPFRICIATLIIIINVFSAGAQIAQTGTRMFAKGFDYNQPLQVGDVLPEMKLSNVINYASDTINLADFKGKAILLNFWAPWCTPCLTAFTKLDSFKRRFSSNLEILPVTSENRQYVTKSLGNLVKARKIGLGFSVVEDQKLKKLFPHTVIPHYVWIDANRRIRAITGSEEITQENIEKLIDPDANFFLPLKKDTRLLLDYTKPFFSQISEHVKNQDIYHSVITKYIKNIGAIGSLKPTWINVTNHSITQLFKIAFGEFDLSFLNNNRLILEGFSQEDSLIIGRYPPALKTVWKNIWKDYTYCYELVVPDSGFTREKMTRIMQDDLNNYFASYKLRGSREKRVTRVLALTFAESQSVEKLKTKGGKVINESSMYYVHVNNLPLSEFLIKLESFFVKEDAPPVVDHTNFKEKVDIVINADLTDLAAVNSELKKYNLRLVEREQEMDMIVIRKLK